MLYDPKWEKPEVKADPFSLESLIAWLEKMPGDVVYRYCCNGHCLLAQYFTAMGYENVEVVPGRFEHGKHEGKQRAVIRFSDDLESVAVGNVEPCRPHTFGAALERAKNIALSKD